MVLPCQGLYVDSGIEAGRPRSEGDGKHSNDAIVPASVAKSPTTRARCFVMVAKSRLMTLNMTTWCTWRMTLN